MVEASTTSSTISGTMTGVGKATETNMWQAQLTGFPIDPPVLYALIIAVAVIVAAVAFLVIRRRKKPIEATTPETETRALEGVVQCEYISDVKSCKALTTDKKGRIIGRETCLNDQKDYCCYQCSLRDSCEINCAYLDERRALSTGDG